MPKRTISMTLEGAINALAKNKDGNQVAAAGRNVFKILSIDDDTNEFSELVNMRVGKNLNLNFSCNDVVWSMLEPNLLATGATNGAVVIWNLNRSNRNKLDSVFQDHKRTVNKVCFHPNESHLLLSGSQDGTMKLFDLRRPEAQGTFLSQSESVRDVQFSPFREFSFSAVQENGNVQIWDLRRADHCEKQFTAHSGPVFSCDWHLEDSRHLATAGRDKTIKVWDVSTAKIKLEHCIQTIASVARIKWRPQRKTQIASSSLVVDFNIYIWDYMRPFVPFASFQEHKDVTTDFVWRDNGPKKLISAGKDGTVYQHFIKDSDRPGLKINPCGLDMNVNGDFFVAVSDNLIRNRRNNSSTRTSSKTKDTSNHQNLLKNSKQYSSHVQAANAVISSVNSPSMSQHSSSSSNSSINTLSNNSSALLSHPPPPPPPPPSAPSSTSTLTFSAANSASLFMKRSISMFHNNSSSNSQNNQNLSNQNQTSQSYQGTHTTSSSNQSNAIPPSLPPPPPELYSSSLFIFKNEDQDTLVLSALRYELSGQNLPDLCEHNAEVAEDLNRPHVAATWRLLKQLYAGQQSHHPHLNPSTSISGVNTSWTSGGAGAGVGSSGGVVEDKGDDLKHRHYSGHQSRHPSGNANVLNAVSNVHVSGNSSSSTTSGYSSQPSTPLVVGGSGAGGSGGGGAGVGAGGGGSTSNPTTPGQIARNNNLNGSNRRSGNNSGGGTTGGVVTSGINPSSSSSSRPPPVTQISAPAGLKMGTTDSDSESEISELLPTPTEKEFNREHQDFFFGDGDVSQSVANLTSYDIATNDNLTQLDDFNHTSLEIPREAFQLRHPIEEFSFPADLDMVNNDFGAMNLIEEDEVTLDSSFKNTSAKLTQQQIKLDFNANQLLSAEIGPTAAFKYAEIVVSMLKAFAQEGDVQTAVSILLVLGDRVKLNMDTGIQEVWFHSYIELLSRFQLWNVISKVIQLSIMCPSVNTLNQLSTSIYTSCTNCGRQLTNKVAWLCDRCKTSTSTCSVCHEVVKGIYVWCQGCSHGGHIEHMMQWFKRNRYCPTGCGHVCEYS